MRDFSPRRPVHRKWSSSCRNNVRQCAARHRPVAAAIDRDRPADHARLQHATSATSVMPYLCGTPTVRCEHLPYYVSEGRKVIVIAIASENRVSSRDFHRYSTIHPDDGVHVPFEHLACVSTNPMRGTPHPLATFYTGKHARGWAASGHRRSAHLRTDEIRSLRSTWLRRSRSKLRGLVEVHARDSIHHVAEHSADASDET